MNCCIGLVFALSAVQADLPADFPLPPPPGKFAQPVAPRQIKHDFVAGKPLVATTYFYWYNASTGDHVIDHDGTDALTDHPPTLEGFSYLNVDWHAGQLADMIDAGIDVALPVYWGSPSGGHGFSNPGLEKLVEARQQMIAKDLHPPAIGMFYDTSTLRYNGGSYHVDLTTEAGRRWFYGTIRDFFSLVPAEHRAYVDGRPLVFLYASAFARNTDDQLFPAVRRMFRREFGTDLFLVKMRGWPGRADSEYQWGGALAPQILETAAFGPGYDHSAVPGRKPLIRTRDDGKFYDFAWRLLLRRDPATRPWLVHIETWNEFHEGTEICETREYGRKYIELTRKYADLFHRGERLTADSQSPAVSSVSASPGMNNKLKIIPMPDGDGPVKSDDVAGRRVWVTEANRFSPTTRYLYFDVDDYTWYDLDETLVLVIEYRGLGAATFRVDYDSADPQLEGLAQQFRSAGETAVSRQSAWQTARFSLPHARLTNRSNGADFRIAVLGGDLAVQRVELKRQR